MINKTRNQRDDRANKHTNKEHAKTDGKHARISRPTNALLTTHLAASDAPFASVPQLHDSKQTRTDDVRTLHVHTFAPRLAKHGNDELLCTEAMWSLAVTVAAWLLESASFSLRAGSFEMPFAMLFVTIAFKARDAVLGVPAGVPSQLEAAEVLIDAIENAFLSLGV